MGWPQDMVCLHKDCGMLMGRAASWQWVPARWACGGEPSCGNILPCSRPVRLVVHRNMLHISVVLACTASAAAWPTIGLISHFACMPLAR